MPVAPLIIQRPQRWDASFDPEMTDAAVVRLLSIEPFRSMRAENFPKRISLEDIIRHDTRLRRFRQSEIIVREGDYGNSAFMIIAGSVGVVLPPGLPAAALGRREPS